MTKLLDISEVSEMLGLSESTLRHWRFTGTGPPAAVVGRRLRYREADVESWIDAQFTSEQT